MACQSEHDWCADTTWENLAVQLFWAPLATQLVLGLTLPILGMKKLQCPLIPVAKAMERMPGVIYGCFMIQGVFSVCVTCIWISRTYKHRVDEHDRIIELVMCAYFIFHYFLMGARKGFIPSYPWEVSSVIDAITVSSVLAAPLAKDASWIGLGYLRVQRCLIAWKNFERAGLWREEDLGELSRAVVGTILRTCALTITLGGTVMILEILGDPEFIKAREQTITTDMGDLSFVQMFYWIFTTMSTVGYGDYSPTTVLSRYFVVFAIVVGVIFFTSECDTVMSLRRDMGSGKGKYFPPFRGIKNVVVLGGGVAQPSALLSSFLAELYAEQHEFRKVGWPSCSLMSVVECPDEIKDMISNLSESGQARVKYFMGNPMDKKDLERLHVEAAELVFIIPNIGFVNKVEEDEGNILRALAVKRYYPRVNLRLACLTPESFRKAINVGIKAERTFSLNEFKSSILSQGCLCRGWTAFLTNLLTSTSGSSEDKDSKNDEKKRGELWLQDYRHGFSQSMYGFCLSSKVAGDSGILFSELVIKALDYGVLPMARVGWDGTMSLCPLNQRCASGDVIFVLASRNSDTKAFRDDSVLWQEELTRLRNGRIRDDTALRAVDGYEEEPRVSRFKSVSGQKKRESFQMPWHPSHPPGKESQEIITILGAGEQLDPEIIQQCETKAEEIAKKDGHYVLVLLSSGLWEQVVAFIKSLRRPQLPFTIPAVILCLSGPPSSMATEFFAKDPSLSFIIGNPTRVQDLTRLNVQSAQAVVLLAGHLAGGDQRMADSAGVIALTSIENMLMEARSFGVPILAEILNEQSLHLLAPKPRWQMREEDEELALRQEPFYKHPRFASGGIFVMNALGGMIAQAYYTRGVIEMVELLVVGAGQEYIPFQIMLPEKYVGKNWGKLVVDFLKQPTCALCLGLYRPCREGQVLDSWFMYTNPPGDTLLCKEDLVTVLGNSDFGKKCHEEGSIATLFNQLNEEAGTQWKQQAAQSLSPGADVVGAETEGLIADDTIAEGDGAAGKMAPKKKKQSKSAAKAKGKV